MTDSHPPKIKAPRALRGRRARSIWTELQPLCAEVGTYNAGTAQLLAALCGLLAEIGEAPNEAMRTDLAQAQAMLKAFRILS